VGRRGRAVPARRTTARLSRDRICLGTVSVMSHPERVNKALAVLALGVALAGASAAVLASAPGTALWTEVALGAVNLAYVVVGTVVMWHRPGHRVGATMAAAGALGAVGEALTVASSERLRDGADSASTVLGLVVGSATRGLAWLVLVLWLPLVFTGERVAPTRLRRAAGRLAAAIVVSFTFVALFAPRLFTVPEFAELDNPIGLPHALLTPMGAIAGLNILAAAVSIVLAICCLVQLHRAGGALGRQQTLLFGLAFLPPILALAPSLNDSSPPWLFAVATFPTPLLIGVAVLQRRLYDLPRLVNQSLTYGALWLGIAALYAVVVGGVGAMTRDQGAAWLPWVAAGVVAVTFAPLRDALQLAANRITYGQWARPEEVISRTARRLADAADVPLLLGSLATDLSTDLGLGYVSVRDRDGHELARGGVRDGAVESLRLTAYGDEVGTLEWNARALRDSDRQLLGDIAAQLGAVVHAMDLLASVRAAQERLVLAREEERQRLRRDLHDGLGPALAGLSLKVDTVRNRIGEGPGSADDLLLQLRGGIQAAVGDVRRIVEGLRPAALDELGLAESVTQLAAQLSGDETQVSADVPALPALPAGVEVAAFRIVQEALTNAMRHACASRVCIHLAVASGTLEVTVSDDGTGLAAAREGGVGLRSMRARAEEIGGSLDIDARPGQGTFVTARLPVDRLGDQ
jgi:signal transduction histidine kinase